MSETPARAKKISVGIIDDHQVLTDALTLVIGNQPDLEVIDVAGTCAAGRALATRACPDVVLLDVGLPDGDGLSLAPEFKRLCPDTQLLVLTSLADERTLLRAIDTGVSGFVSKNQPLSEMIAAIRQAADGEIVMPTALLLGLVARTARARGDRSDYLAQQGREPLTPREQEILTCLARGTSGGEIAAELHIAPLTVRTHVRNLMEKLGVHSRLEAVSLAIRIGLVKPPA